MKLVEEELEKMKRKEVGTDGEQWEGGEERKERQRGVQYKE